MVKDLCKSAFLWVN